MRSLTCMMAILLALTACDSAKEQGQQTVRTLSGGQMMDQKNAMKQQLNKVEQQQKERYGQLDEQLKQQDKQ
jgi:hypothetical protein